MKGQAYDRLAFLTDTFGHRLSGSAALERAIGSSAQRAGSRLGPAAMR